MVNKVAEIIITPGKHFDKSHHNGGPYTGVSMNGHNYSSGSPCETEEQIKSAIDHCKEWVEKKGDKWKIIDKRIQQKKLF